jgi:hypothetical protein
MTHRLSLVGGNVSDHIMIQEARDARWHLADPASMPDEQALHEYVHIEPDLLPLREMGERISPLMIIGHELTLPTGGGILDLLAIDRDGLPTIIEFKLKKNADIKRKVVGQVLEYAAYLWKLSYDVLDTEVAREYFNSKACKQPQMHGLALAAAIEHFNMAQQSSPDWDVESFVNNADANLKQGRFRLIVVVDEAIPELRRTIDYLNAMQTVFQIVCVEMRYYATDHGTHVFVPVVVAGRFASRQPEKTESTVHQWDEASFMETLADKKGPGAQLAAQALLAWGEKYTGRIKWGTGVQYGSFSVIARKTKERLVNVLTIWTNGWAQINFDYARYYTPFDNEQTRREWLERLNAIKGVHLPDKAINGVPSISLGEVLANEDNIKQFTSVMEWVIDQLNHAHGSDE